MSMWVRYDCPNCNATVGENTTFCPKCGEYIRHSTSGSGGCFIATACYGIKSKEVSILKNWRDKKLLKSNLGRGFVKFYYKTSPPIANFISDKPRIKKVVRFGLRPLTKFID